VPDSAASFNQSALYERLDRSLIPLALTSHAPSTTQATPCSTIPPHPPHRFIIRTIPINFSQILRAITASEEEEVGDRRGIMELDLVRMEDMHSSLALVQPREDSAI
jgi:hypothetical protein